jgi:hypothetical protein
MRVPTVICAFYRKSNTECRGHWIACDYIVDQTNGTYSALRQKHGVREIRRNFFDVMGNEYQTWTQWILSEHF